MVRALHRRLVVGTRGSRLARAQTEEALAPLRVLLPDLEIEIRVIRTAGDRDRRMPLAVIGGTGVFAKEIERALSAEVIDLAVHSAKDLPPALERGLALLAVPPREDPRDAVVSRDGMTIQNLPPGSRVGTGSARRRALLLRARPDLEIVDARGNVETRIALVRNGTVDAVILAAAGLSRLGRLAEASEVMSFEQMLPSPGQGALALEGRVNDDLAHEVAALLDDPASHAAVTAERAFLGRLGSGCSSPVAAYARSADGTIEIQAAIVSVNGQSAAFASMLGPIHDAEALGVQLAVELMGTDLSSE
jgi:hydroxymethylbilane synthase